MKQIISINVDDVEFTADIFEIDETKELEDQITIQVSQANHSIYYFNNVWDAVQTATTLLEGDNKYNYALISQITWEVDEKGERTFKDAVYIGDIWAGEPTSDTLN